MITDQQPYCGFNNVLTYLFTERYFCDEFLEQARCTAKEEMEWHGIKSIKDLFYDVDTLEKVEERLGEAFDHILCNKLGALDNSKDALLGDIIDFALCSIDPVALARHYLTKLRKGVE